VQKAAFPLVFSEVFILKGFRYLKGLCCTKIVQRCRILLIVELDSLSPYGTRGAAVRKERELNPDRVGVNFPHSKRSDLRR
jgi:hypothetical protein